MPGRLFNAALRDELVDMACEILQGQATAPADGGFHGGAAPEVREMHKTITKRLSDIVDAFDWPGKSLVDEEGADAAWIILQHSISDPAFVRRCLPLLQQSAAAGEIPMKHPAYLTDRIRVLEGKPQVYGTQFDWDDAGSLSPLPIENPFRVDQLRKKAGLIPLEKDLQLKRYALAQSIMHPPLNIAEYRKKFEAWCKEHGWR